MCFINRYQYFVNIKLFTRIVLIQILLCFSIIHSTSVFAVSCLIKFPDPWYKTSFKFDNLPSGVNIEKIAPSESTREEYAVSNSSSTPFYIVEKIENPFNNITYPNSELPKDIKPYYKFVNGEVYEYASRNLNEAASWKKIKETSEKSSPHQYKQLIYLLSFIGAFQDQNVYADNRPSSVSIPALQEFSFLAYSGLQPVQIEAAVSYELNAEYDPQAQAKGKKACSESIKSWDSLQTPLGMIAIYAPIIFLILCVIFVPLFILILIKRRYNKKL